MVFAPVRFYYWWHSTCSSQYFWSDIIPSGQPLQCLVKSSVKSFPSDRRGLCPELWCLTWPAFWPYSHTCYHRSAHHKAWWPICHSWAAQAGSQNVSPLKTAHSQYDMQGAFFMHHKQSHCSKLGPLAWPAYSGFKPKYFPTMLDSNCCPLCNWATGRPISIPSGSFFPFCIGTRGQVL